MNAPARPEWDVDAVPTDDFSRIYARLQMLARSGEDDLFAVCLALQAEHASIAGLLRPTAFAGLVVAVPLGFVLPHPEQRRTSIITLATKDTVAWVYRAIEGAHAALPLLRERGAEVLK